MCVKTAWFSAGRISPSLVGFTLTLLGGLSRLPTTVIGKDGNASRLTVGEKMRNRCLGLLAIGCYPPLRPPTELESLLDDDVPIWEPGDAKNSEEEQRVPCVFLWLADETRGKVLARDSRVAR